MEAAVGELTFPALQPPCHALALTTGYDPPVAAVVHGPAGLVDLVALRATGASTVARAGRNMRVLAGRFEAERTYIMIKPDGVQRGLVGQIIQRFESKGFFLRGMKMMSVEKAHAEKHYADLSSKPFFGDLVDYMCSGPVVCMVWEGKEVVKTGRKIIGATNPL